MKYKDIKVGEEFTYKGMKLIKTARKCLAYCQENYELHGIYPDETVNEVSVKTLKPGDKFTYHGLKHTVVHYNPYLMSERAADLVVAFSHEDDTIGWWSSEAFVELDKD